MDFQFAVSAGLDNLAAVVAGIAVGVHSVAEEFHLRAVRKVAN